MKKMTSTQFRNLFLEYFKKNGHMIEPSASLIPYDDPTLLWINSGVAALKKYFDGSKKPLSPRIVNAQKSIRTNDIENVGKTARHHTFFEMLGNFSIGDYFKKEAIHFAWEFLTSDEYVGFDKDKLYITVYLDDEEAYRIWVEECHVDPSHILKTAGNFWQIGEGPCGPNSEIFYDRGNDFDPEKIGEKLFFDELENDRYIEIWNVVFSQYDAKEGVERKSFKELPHQNIDTGMGLERMLSIIQDGETNFDTDLFLPIIHQIEMYTKIKYEDNKMAFRVIADHIRTVTFALADGAAFSNEGRGYVLRRVLRRAVRFGRQLEINKAFMYELVVVVSTIMRDQYGYIQDKIEYIQKLIKSEEEKFHLTLIDGEKLLHEVMLKETNQLVDGKTAFRLYDTYGFPLELTLEIAHESGFKVDETGFMNEMEKQKQRARDARENLNSMASQSVDLMDFDKPSEFIGYDVLECEAKVIGLFQDGKKVDQITGRGEVIFDRTACYAESGGQVGDIALIEGSVEGEITNTIKAPHKQALHTVEINKGVLQVGETIRMRVNEARRHRITCNHSATHLLQSAIRKVVGNHIEQAGSFVSEEYFRFDFTHYEKVSGEQLKAIERMINHFIEAHVPVTKMLLPIEEAKKSGAIALFDEKYGDVVRVVNMADISKEFCGGCHVNNTEEIGICKLISEESIGSGIRRITGKSGFFAYEEYSHQATSLENIAELLKTKNINDVVSKVEHLHNQYQSLKKEYEVLQNQNAINKANDMIRDMKDMNGYKVYINQINDLDGSILKDIVTTMKNQVENGIIFLASIKDEKIIFVAGASKKAIAEGIKSGELVKIAAQICDGNGGGKPDLAQAGGKDITKLAEALAEIHKILNVSL